MIRRFLFLTPVAVLLVGVACLVLEHWRGRRDLAAARGELRALGEPVDLVDLDLSVTPMAARAYDEFARAAGDAGENPPAVPGPRWIAPGTVVASVDFGTWDGGGAVIWNRKLLREWVGDRSGALDRLRATLATPARQPPIDYSQGFTKLLLPHLSPVKQGIIALGISALDHVLEGDFEEALADLRSSRRLADDLARRPTLIEHLVHVACLAIVRNRVFDLFYSGRWDDRQLAALQEFLQTPELNASWRQAIRGERVLVLQAIDTVSADELEGLMGPISALGGGTAPPAVDLSSLPGDLEAAKEVAEGVLTRVAHGFRMKVLWPIWQFAWRDQSLAFYLRDTQRLIDLSSREPLSFLRISEAIGHGRAKGGLGRVRGLLSSLLSPVMESSLARLARFETEQELLVTALALERFVLRHGQYPERLDELVPEFLAAVPIDRMDGQPLRYRREADGAFTLWGIGENQVDDGGDATSESGRPSSQWWWMARDTVWPRRASPEEIAEWQAKEQQRRAAAKPRYQMSPELMKRYGLLPTSTPTNPPPAP